jgi:CheY-like chemotaxis protein
MPKMGGVELTDRLRSARPDTRVLLMSGYSEYCSGPRDPVFTQTPILQKPFSRPALVEKIREVLAAESREPASTVKRI